MGSYQLERLNGIEKYLHDAGNGVKAGFTALGNSSH
jgi:hypothetical protein